MAVSVLIPWILLRTKLPPPKEECTFWVRCWKPKGGLILGGFPGVLPLLRPGGDGAIAPSALSMSSATAFAPQSFCAGTPARLLFPAQRSSHRRHRFLGGSHKPVSGALVRIIIQVRDTATLILPTSGTSSFSHLHISSKVWCVFFSEKMRTSRGMPFWFSSPPPPTCSNHIEGKGRKTNWMHIFIKGALRVKRAWRFKENEAHPAALIRPFNPFDPFNHALKASPSIHAMRGKHCQLLPDVYICKYNGYYLSIYSQIYTHIYFHTERCTSMLVFCILHLCYINTILR